MLRLTVALSCVALTHSVRSYLEADELNVEAVAENATAKVDARLYDMMGGRMRTPECLVSYPDSILTNFPKIKCLGSGSFGVSYLTYDKRKPLFDQSGRPLKDKYGQPMYEQVVVKLLYTQGSGGKTHLTWATASANYGLKEKALEASAECDIASDIQNLGSGIGRKRIMACYEHNIPPSGTIKTAPDVPLFLILQNCGAQPLTHYVTTQSTNIPLMALLFKQLLEALDFLSTSTFSYIHHDLKPDNIVVKEDGGDYFLYLIDFGGTVKSSTQCRDVTKITASSPAYAPHEWKSRTTCGMSNYDPNAPWAFDMYAAAVVALDLASGSMYGKKEIGCPACDLLVKHGSCPPSAPYNDMDCSLSMATYAPGHSTGYVCLAEELGLTSMGSANNPFFIGMADIAKALDPIPANRPKPKDFLASAVWKNVPSQGLDRAYGTAPSPVRPTGQCKKQGPTPSPPPPAYSPGNYPAYSPGNYPAYSPGNKPGNSPGNYPAYSPGNYPAYSPGNKPAYSPGANYPAYSPGNKPAYSPGNNYPAYSPGANYPAYSPGGGGGNYMPQKYNH